MATTLTRKQPKGLIVERLKRCMDASPHDTSTRNRLAVAGHFKYSCPHCNSLLMSVVPGGVGVPVRNSRQLKLGWCFSTEEHFPDLETVLTPAQRSIPHEVIVRMGDCLNCGEGFALLEIKVATHAKHIVAVEKYPDEKTYRITVRQNGNQWPMIKELKNRGYTLSHWFDMLKLREPLNAGLFAVDVREALGGEQLAELQDLIKQVWEPIVDQLPAYTLKVSSAA